MLMMMIMFMMMMMMMMMRKSEWFAGAGLLCICGRQQEEAALSHSRCRLSFSQLLPDSDTVHTSTINPGDWRLET